LEPWIQTVWAEDSRIAPNLFFELYRSTHRYLWFSSVISRPL
jgi:hypothetical protein